MTYIQQETLIARYFSSVQASQKLQEYNQAVFSRNIEEVMQTLF